MKNDLTPVQTCDTGCLFAGVFLFCWLFLWLSAFDVPHSHTHTHKHTPFCFPFICAQIFSLHCKSVAWQKLRYEFWLAFVEGALDFIDNFQFTQNILVTIEKSQRWTSSLRWIPFYRKTFSVSHIGYSIRICSHYMVRGKDSGAHIHQGNGCQLNKIKRDIEHRFCISFGATLSDPIFRTL